MFSRAALAAFALILAEFVVFGVAVEAAGFVAVALASLALAAAGAIVVRRQFGAVHGRSLSSLGSADELSDRSVLAGAGVLLIVPGLLTGAAGLVLLLLPPARARAGGFLRRQFARLVPTGLGMPFPMPDRFNADLFANDLFNANVGDVVDVDLVSEDEPPLRPPGLS